MQTTNVHSSTILKMKTVNIYITTHCALKQICAEKESILENKDFDHTMLTIL